MRGALVSVGIVVAALFAVTCTPSRQHDDGPCMVGETNCDGDTFQTCVDGHFADQQTCPTACSAAIGCTLCAAGTGTCTGNISHACNADGMGFTDITCDPAEGLSCDSATGVCAGDCSSAALGSSYIGCDYYPTVTGNLVASMFHYAVAVGNTGGVAATVTVTGGALTAPDVFTVAANSVQVEALPWQFDLKLCDSSDSEACQSDVSLCALVAKGAYHLQSTEPVTVYQFNALEYELDGVDSFTNDASLLLPTNTWRQNYYVASWEPLEEYELPGELAVTAAHDNTMVTIDTKASTIASGGAPAFTAGTPQTVMLNQGDVIELTSLAGDLTGSTVTSDQPVAVIGGSYCSYIPDHVTACDHIEESMFPVDELGENYIVNAPAVTTIPAGKVEVVRVIATAPNTTLTYAPPQSGAPTSIANPGDFVEISGNDQSFLITADQKVLVAQYMEGEDAGGGTGDPAMALAVPIEQFRSSYLFHAPTTYETNYVDVTAPMGASVMLDGVPLAFDPIGTTGWGLARVQSLSAGPASDGNHSIEGSMGFGITVYGYGQYTSYWYPGGLNLGTIIE